MLAPIEDVLGVTRAQLGSRDFYAAVWASLSRDAIGFCHWHLHRSDFRWSDGSIQAGKIIC